MKLNIAEEMNGNKYDDTYEKKRVRIIRELIPSVANAQRALDIACGPGVYSKILNEKGYTTVGFDISSPDLDEANRSIDNASFMRMDALHLGFKDNAFDLVLALEILEHVENPVFFLDELLRVCKKEGIIVISTPNKQSLEGLKGKIYEKITGKRWVAWDTTHKTIFKTKQLRDILIKKTSIKRIVGYYYIPRIHINIIDAIFNPLRYLHTYRSPFNLFGFNAIFMVKKL